MIYLYRYMCYMIRLGVALLFSALCMVSMVQAAPQLIQDMRVGSSPNPLGSGARALGMGSAFIAVADDATAASWNPAGLVQLETPELSIVGSSLRRSEQHVSVTFPAVNGDQQWQSSEINYFSVATPSQIFGYPVVVSLNYQALYDFNRKMNYNYQYSGSEVTPPLGLMDWTINQRNDYKQSGGLRAISPALAFNLTPAVTAGFTLNWWTDKLGYANGWSSESTSMATGTFGVGVAQAATNITIRQQEIYDKIDGLNAHMGLMWEVSPKIRLGAVLKSPFTIKMRHRFSAVTTGTVIGSSSITENVNLHLPWSYGLGAALRYSDAFTVALDVFRTEWSYMYMQSENGIKTNPIDGLPMSQTRVKATQQVRLGSEYLFILPKIVIPVRAGIYYDPQPSPDGKENVYGISLGSGLAYKNLVFDLAYTFDWGNGLNGTATGVPNSQYKLRRHRLYSSLIVHF